jgi:small subunit ribosomal protein S19
LTNIKEGPAEFHNTHERDIVIIPEMLGANLGIYNGKEFVRIEIQPEMLGYRLGDFSMTRQRVKHSAPGAGATRGSKHIPLK